MPSADAASKLAEAVATLAAAAQPLSDADLGQPYRWGAHNEGARFALIGATHEMRALAVRRAAERRRAGPPLTRAHHALGQYHAAYRDLQAVLLDGTPEEYDASPAPGEWPLRYVYSHMVGAERNFFALVHYGLRRQREAGDLPAKLPNGEADRLFGPFNETFLPLMENGTRADVAAFHAVVHDRALNEFAGATDEELDGPSLWWEGETYSLEYRLHRFEAHLRQHTIQLERTLDQLGRPANEARRLIRQLYAALAEAEATQIGAPPAADAAELAAALVERATELTDAIARAGAFIESVKAGDEVALDALLAADANLAHAMTADGVPTVRLALYYGRAAIAERLAGAVEELEIWDAASLGRAALVEELHKGWGELILNEVSRDGYTPLQLACFFGHEEVARYLIEKGADVSAVSRNRMTIQPLHAAAAGDHNTIARLLLEAGADPNAAQQDGFRPLHEAAQNGNNALVELLLAHGADPALTDAHGRTARDLAVEAGHGTTAALLSPVAPL